MRKSVIIALFDQGILSLFNLGINLALIRFAAPMEFGRFIYALTLILVMTSLQNALVATPITVMLPGRIDAERRSGLSTLVSFDLGLRMGCALLAGALCFLTEWSPAFIAATVLAVFTTLARETARNIYIASDRVRKCLMLDALTVVSACITIALCWTIFKPAVVCLIGLTVGNIVGLIVLARGLGGKRMQPGMTVSAYTKFWKKTKWSLVGAATTEVQYRNYVFAIEFFRSTSTLAYVQAGRLVIGPLILIVQSWGRIAKPAMAKALALRDPRKALNTLYGGLVLIFVICVVYFAALAMAWPWLEDLIFHGKYPGIAIMTLAWAGFAFVNVFNHALASLLIAANELRDLAMVSIGTAIITCILLIGLSFAVPPVYAVYVLIVGEVIALAWLIVLSVRLFSGSRLVTRPVSVGGE